MNHILKAKGFTLIEIAIVLLIVTILLGYTVALFPIQQELKQYRAAEKEMSEVLQAIVGFSQTNGRLPCPARPDTFGKESGGGVANCAGYTGHDIGKPWIGFVPVNTLGIEGRMNEDGLLLDPWGNPYRYYVTDSDFFEDADDPSNSDISDFGAPTDPDGDGISDFVRNGEMRDIGLVDIAINEDNAGADEIDIDGYLDLDPNLIICDRASASSDRCNNLSQQVIGDVSDISPAAGNYSAFTYTGYAGVPVVLLSMGKNWAETPAGDELENRGSLKSTTNLGMPIGPRAQEYFFDTDTVFVKRRSGMGSDFDDLVKWISPNILYSKMIEAGQLP